MSVPRTRATIASPATTSRVLFNKPIKVAPPIPSEIQIDESPAAAGAESCDYCKAEAGHRHRGEGEDAGVRNHREIEDDKRARQRDDQWMHSGQGEATK